MRPIKCAVFDLDGTLTQSEEGIFNCVLYAADRLGFPRPDGDTLRKFVGPPLRWSFMEYMGMSDAKADDALEIYRERYNAVGLFENRVYPGVRRLLRTLRQQGWYVAMATGKPEEFNCLFCYCPLYALGDRCGGNFRYTEKGTKDCTGCMIPHKKDNYGYILEKFKDVAELARKKPE